MSTRKRLRRALAHEIAGDLELGTREDGQPLWISTEDLKRHAHFIGPTGMGKTRAMCLLLKQLIDRADSAVVVLDPLGAPGGLYHTLKDHCYARCPERLVTLDPHDVDSLSYAAGFNPLLQGADATVQAAYGVEHLQATTSNEAVAQATGIMLRVWAFRLLLGMISAELAMADAGRILAPGAGQRLRLGISEALKGDYQEVADHWQRFLDDTKGRGARATQEYERVIGSTERRISQYVLNKRIRYMLSGRSNAIDFNEVFSQRKVFLANLSVGNIMMPDDQRLLGMQIVHEICRAAKGQAEAPVPCYFAIDEFQEFLTPDIYEALNFGRNFNLRLLIAHQNLRQLVTVAGQEWRIFHAVMSNATLKVVFGGLPPDDLDVLGKHLYGPYLDNYRVKQEIWRTIQLSHVENVTVEHESSSTSRGRGEGATSATGETSVLPGDGNQLFPDVASTAVSEAQSTAYSKMFGESETRGSTTGPMVMPDEPTQELSSREFMRLDEQLWERASKLSRQPPQFAIIQRDRAHEPESFRVADDPPPFITLAELEDLDRERFPSLPWTSPLSAIEAEARERLERFERDFCPPLPSPKAARKSKDQGILEALKQDRKRREQ